MTTHRATSTDWAAALTTVNGVGSGLILLVIVGAWLAVLVPMALRSHDSATSLRSTDRFGNAMRVLAKRGAGRDVLMPRRGAAGVVLSRGPAVAGSAATKGGWLGVAGVLVGRRRATGANRGAVQRRIRTLCVLLLATLATLVAGLTGSVGWLAAHLACDLLLLAFVVQLRRQAVLRSQQHRAEGHRTPVVRRAAPAAGSDVARVRVAGIPDRMPDRLAERLVEPPVAAPAMRHDEPVPVLAVGSWDGASWSPVSVPPPTYVGKGMAPARRTRVLDLTRPGQWTAAMEDDELDLLVLAEGPELDEILDRRRAVND